MNKFSRLGILIAFYIFVDKPKIAAALMSLPLGVGLLLLALQVVQGAR